MEFALSAPAAPERIKVIADPSLILDPNRHQHAPMSGLEKCCRRCGPNGRVPVSMITVYGDEDAKRRAIAQGAVGLLTNPIDFAVLRQEIDTRLDKGA